jgi:hypothetical protein
MKLEHRAKGWELVLREERCFIEEIEQAF